MVHLNLLFLAIKLINGPSLYFYVIILFVRSGFIFASYLLFSSSSVCRLLSKGKTYLQTACLRSWFASYFLCMECMRESLGDKNQRKKRHLSNLAPSSAWTQTESLQACCLWSFSLYSTAGEKLPCIWHQLALGRASLWWSCFSYFKEARHKDIEHAFYGIWEKSTFKKYQHCLSGH